MRAKVVSGARKVNSRMTSLNTDIVGISGGQNCTAEDPCVIVNKPFMDNLA